jgi:Tfp pilus assembly protein PilX
MNKSGANNLLIRQTGAATILIAIFLLLTMTVLVIFTANTAVLEQRMSANEVRAKTAAAAAQAGLERALGYLQSGGNSVSTTFSENGDSVFRARFVAVGTPLVECPVNPNAVLSLPPPANTRNLLVYSCGWSDDLSARKMASVQVRAGPALARSPSFPLVARGAVNTNGRARVFNFFEDMTIWTGSDVNITGNPGNTFVRNPLLTTAPNPADPLPAEPANCGIHTNYVCTTDMNKIGGDVLDNDVSLGNLTRAEYFEQFMGLPKADFRNFAIERDTSNLSDIAGQVTWIEGDVTSLPTPLGSRDNPVVLVVNGDLTLAGNNVFHGVLYVTGDLITRGTPRFYGSTIVEGQLNAASGTPYFIYDPEAKRIAREETGRRTGLSGTWRDWP